MLCWQQAPLLCFGIGSLPDLPVSEAGLSAGFHACGCFRVIITWMSRAALHPWDEERYPGVGTSHPAVPERFAARSQFSSSSITI